MAESPWWATTNQSSEPLTREKLEAAIAKAYDPGINVGVEYVGPPLFLKCDRCGLTRLMQEPTEGQHPICGECRA